jgi:hypothetical protein
MKKKNYIKQRLTGLESSAFCTAAVTTAFTTPEAEDSLVDETGGSATTGPKLSVLVDRLILQIVMPIVNETSSTQ